MSTQYTFKTYYGQKTFDILHSHDTPHAYQIYLIVFHNKNMTLWQSPLELPKKLIDVKYFLSYQADRDFVFDKSDIKYVCTVKLTELPQQLNYILKMDWTTVLGTFET